MEQIKNYIMTILAVFICLSAIFILILLIKFIINLRKNEFKNKKYTRGKYESVSISLNDINSENKQSYNLNVEKVCKYDNGDMYKGEFVKGKRNGFGIYIFSYTVHFIIFTKSLISFFVCKYTYTKTVSFSFYKLNFIHISIIIFANFLSI